MTKTKKQSKKVVKKNIKTVETSTNQWIIEKDSTVTGIDKKGNMFIISKKDFKRVSQYTWYVDSNGYVAGYIDGKRIYLHRFIMEVSDRHVQVDHRDGIKFNNRRSNLRKCSNGENQMNTRGVKGYIVNSNGTFSAKIVYEKKVTNLGTYKNEDFARIAYVLEARKIFGKFVSDDIKIDYEVYKETGLIKLFKEHVKKKEEAKKKRDKEKAKKSKSKKK